MYIPKRVNKSYRKLTPAKVAEARGLYIKGNSVNSIAKVLQIARNSVANYRDKENWDEFKFSIAKKIEQKVETRVVNEQVRYINLGRLLQQRGMHRVRMILDDDINARDAMDFIKTGIQIEKDATGGGEKVIGIKITLPEGYEDL